MKSLKSYFKIWRRNFDERKNMFCIKKLKIKGFRGYMDEKEFSFDTPFVLLFGENHRGKSSTLNAIEWCLFGDECVGVENTGIRERKSWVIRNRYLPSHEEVFVEVELEDVNGGTYKIRRKWISERKDELKITLPNGEILKNENAKEKLTQLFRFSFRDFLTTVYQHQESIRAILTEQPEKRDDAIERLLGLLDYRNILLGINSAKIEEKQKEINQEFEKFKKKIEGAFQSRTSDLQEKKKKAIEEGIEENNINERGALEIAKSIKDELYELYEFALDTGFPPAKLEIPENWKDLKEKFLNIVEKEINSFFYRIPEGKRVEELSTEKRDIEDIRSQYNEKNDYIKQLKKDIDEFIKKYGNEEELNRRKNEIEEQICQKEKKMEEMNRKGKIISDAIEYLEMEDVDKNICPVCGKETFNLLTHLKEEWKKNYEPQIGKIKEEIEGLKNQKNDVKGSLEQLEDFNKKLKKAEDEIGEVKKKIEEKLNRKITEKDDPLVLLNKRLEEIKEELEKLQPSLKEWQKKLNNIQKKAKQIYQIIEILELEEKRKIVEKIKDTNEYRQIEDQKNKMAELLEALNIIKEAIKETSLEEAERKIGLAENKISEFFCEITNNPTVKKIKILTPKKTGKNYEFKDQDEKDLTPVLSQGDLNVLALSIFLGLSFSLDTPFGFVILDDPSQSLGFQYKKKLIEILDKISESRTIILSTMDKELQDLIFSQLTKAKTKYTFKNWTPEKGPEVEKE